MRIRHVAVGGVVLAGSIAALSGPASATSKTGKKVAAKYKLDPKRCCLLCHDAGKGKPRGRNVNRFGKAFEKAYKKKKKDTDRVSGALAAIAGEDFDGDGATNMEEVVLGTLPGDSKSVPAAEKLAEYRKANRGK